MLRRRDKEKGLILVFVAFSCLPSASEAMEAEKSISVRTVPGILRPGEAFLVRVTAGSTVTDVGGEVFGKKIYFEKSGPAYFSLSGVDLFQEPGTYPLTVIAGPERIQASIRIAKKRFGKETLHLPPDQVILRPEDLRRVEQEKKVLDAIWGEELPMFFWSGPFVLPVRGSFGSGFGVRRIINGEPRSPHMGQDIKAPEGTPVGSCNAGKIIFTGDLFFSGKSVIVDHGHGLYSMYFHLSEILVKNGDDVGGGQAIGKVGATGRASGPHLHWGMRLQGMRVDPMSFLSLPLDDVQR